jgi:hypothetical protein
MGSICPLPLDSTLQVHVPEREGTKPSIHICMPETAKEFKRSHERKGNEAKVKLKCEAFM